MAATVASKLNLSFTSLLQNAIGLAAAQASIEKSLIVSLATGTGANQADRIFSEAAKTISVSTDIDLSGALVDALGAACVFVRVKALLVTVDAASVSNLVVGGDANAALIGFGAVAHTVTIRPGGALLIYSPDATGYPITPGTGDILQFAPSGASALFDYAVLGCSV
jgi:pyruvate/2-oxoacid:ferredoxin oxidoreductase beta subunit